MPKTHVIEKGDCLSSVAYRHGYLPATIWQHPDNAKLRELRGDPNVLLAGDALVIPDRDPLEAACDTGKRHRFVRKAVPARFRLQLMNVDRPRAGVAYRLTIDDAAPLEGTTPADGVIDVPIPPDARRGRLHLVEDGADYELRFGELDPPGEGRGVRQRLTNLGYLRGDDAESASAQQLAEALRMFQRRAGLPGTGEIDDATRQALVGAHDTARTAKD